MIWLWDITTGTFRNPLTGHTDAVSSVCFSPNGNTLASGGEDKTVRFWDVATGELQQTLKGHTHKVYSVCFSPDGQILASAGWAPDAAICLWDVSTGTLRNSLTGDTVSDVLSVCFSPDGNTLASGNLAQTEGWGTSIHLWDVSTGTLRKTLNSFIGGFIDGIFGHDGSVYSVCFSPDGQLLASGYSGASEGSASGPIWLWDATTGEHLTTLTGHPDTVNSVCFSPDGRTLASGSEDGTVLLWNIASPALEKNR